MEIMIIILIPSKPLERMRNKIPAKITCIRMRIPSLASPGGIMTFTTHNRPVKRISTTDIQESETAIEAIATESMAASTPDILSAETALEAIEGEANTIASTVIGRRKVLSFD